MSNWQEMEKKYLIHEYRPLADSPGQGQGFIYLGRKRPKVPGFSRRLGCLLFGTQSSGNDESSHQTSENTGPDAARSPAVNLNCNWRNC